MKVFTTSLAPMLLGAGLLGIGIFVGGQAQAALIFDSDVTPDIIFGSGNANGAFTVDQGGGVELGLRGKLRFNASNQPENTFNYVGYIADGGSSASGGSRGGLAPAGSYGSYASGGSRGSTASGGSYGSGSGSSGSSGSRGSTASAGSYGTSSSGSAGSRGSLAQAGGYGAGDPAAGPGYGIYQFDTGAPSGGAGWVTLQTPLWNFEWSINTNYDGTGGTFEESGLTFVLGMDFDPGLGQDYYVFDPINMLLADHAFGNNGTGNGGGTVAGDALEYEGLLALDNVAQNSWNYQFFPDAPQFPTFDPNADGSYFVFLNAYDDNDALVASTSIELVIGAGAPSVPEPATLPLMLTGLLGAGWVLRRRKAA